jgi:hypothetical protein
MNEKPRHTPGGSLRPGKETLGRPCMSECALTMFPYGVLDIIRRMTFGHSDASEAAAPSLRSNSRLSINQQIFGAEHT